MNGTVTPTKTTGIIATIRALLAAGWRNDSVYQAGGNTCREMLHPSGREITARTSVYGDDTSLTMTGLTLDQVAGAINGAGLAPTEPASDPRQVAWQLVINGVAGGLPIPAAVNIPGHYRIFEVRVPTNDSGGADAWAAYLGLDAPEMEPALEGCKHDVYRSETYSFPPLPGWKVEVTAYCDKPAAEVTR